MGRNPETTSDPRNHLTPGYGISTEAVNAQSSLSYSSKIKKGK